MQRERLKARFGGLNVGIRQIRFGIIFILLSLGAILIILDLFPFFVIIGTGILFFILSIIFAALYGIPAIIISVFYNILSCLFVYNRFIRNGDKFFIPFILYWMSATLGMIVLGIYAERNRQYVKKMRSLAEVDSLTKIYNQRFFQKRLVSELGRAVRNNTSLAVIFCDIDHFKTINEHFGHQFSDQVLVEAAQLISMRLRGQDTFCRYEGDEFALILPETDCNQAESLIMRINESLSAYSKSKFGTDETFFLTMSYGCSCYPELAKNEDELFAQADTALYRAKQSGRNNYLLYYDIFENVKTSVECLDSDFFKSLKVILWTLSSKDYYTYGHSERVAEYALIIGKKLGLDTKELSILQIIGLLHDIGKIEIPLDVLNKKDRLTAEEHDLVRRHPLISARILTPLAELGTLIKDISHHHERYDGKGYPLGLQGNAIPRYARVLCVVDAYDAMRSDRPYRRGLSLQSTVKEIENNLGKQFDPYIGRVFLNEIANSDGNRFFKMKPQFFEEEVR